MDELESLRKKRLASLQQQQQKEAQRQAQEQQQLQQQIAQLENVVKQSLTKDALARYGNIKAAYPDKAVQLLAVLGEAIQSGRLHTIDDATLKLVLKKMEPEKREFTIKRV